MSEFKRISELETLPLNTTGTGTVTATNSVYVEGTGTVFTEELGLGDFIADLTNGEVARVERVESDTLIVVDVPFTSLSGNLEYIKAYNARTLWIQVADLDGNGATVNGETLPDSGLPIELGQPNPNQARKLMVRPVVIDGSSSEVGATIQTILN